MTDYQKPYYLLFNAITDALVALVRLDVPAATRLLLDAKIKGVENIFG